MLKHKKENGIIAKYETDLFPAERQAGNMAKKLHSYRQQGFLRADLTVCLFLIAILMQSSVNALNDYADFVKGTDTAENSPDPTDAVIVYGMRPETARNLGIAYLTAAFVLGAYTVWRCGWVLLVIGLIGALVIAAYSGGKTPISYLPLGELVSGFVMGGLIPLAGVRMQTGVLRFSVLAEALPVIIGIGMIMFSNNGCDIERDLQAGRRTLPCLLGREKTDRLYRMMLAVWLLSPVLIFAVQRRWMSMLLYVLSSLVFLSHFCLLVCDSGGMKMKNEKEEYVFRVFQSIAEGYDSANRRISLGAHLRWKKSAVKSMMASLPEGAALLDIGCGTGDMLRIFSELCPASALTGLDFSPNMLKAAEANLRDVPNLTLQQGNALDLPFPDASFDGVSISFALRNTADYLRALQEAFRVLKAGGMLLVIDSFVPESPVVRPFYDLYFAGIMPLLGGGVKKRKEYRWLTKSTKEFISVSELQALVRRAGFENAGTREFLFGACSYVLGKKRDEKKDDS